MKKEEIQDCVFDLDVYGLCVLKGILDEKTVEQFRAALDHLSDHNRSEEIRYSSSGAGIIESQSKLINLFTRDQIFSQLIDHPKVLPIVKHCLGEELILASLNGRILTNKMPEQKIHTDIPYQLWNRDNEIMLNVMWLIDDFKENNGATVFLPMSHRSSYPGPPANKPVKYLEKMIAPAGTAVIFNGSIWHGSTKNETDEPRRAIFSQYRVGHWMNFQFDPKEEFDKDWMLSLNREQQRLLRINNNN